MKNAPALAIVTTASLAVLVLGVVAQNLPGSRERLHDEIEPDIAALLPMGAVETARAELPDAPQTARAVAYSLGGVQYLALVAWDKEGEGYRSAPLVAYEGEDESPFETSGLFVESLGLGAPVAVVARGPLGASTELVTVFARSGNALRPVMMTGEDGRTVPAQFVTGASATHVEGVRFDDVDGDGDKDAVATVAEMFEGARAGETSAVHAWRDGMFVHDAELSRTVSLRGVLFPEPDAAPEVTEQE